MAKPFAVFDIDGTIARSSLLQLIVRELVNNGHVGVGPGIEIDKLLHDYRQRITDDSFGAFMKKAVDIMFSDSKDGIRLADYDKALQNVMSSQLANTYIYTTQLIKTLHQNGYFIIAISGSELRAVEYFGKALGFDAWLGAVQYEVAGDKLTGNLKALPYKKDVILRAMIGKFDLTTKGSLAVGDTSSDIAMLEMVEQPIAFNPNQALFKHASAKKWMVVIERKDMIYGLTKDGDTYKLTTTNA